MRKFLIYLFFFSAVGCFPKEDISIPIEIENRKTIEVFYDVRAYLDVEKIENGTEILYFFSFELQGSPQSEKLVPGKDHLICGFLNEELMYGMPILEDCELEGYYSRYLDSYFWPANNRLNVTISGEVKEGHPDDVFTGLPFLLSDIQKIESCPIELIPNQEPMSLENQFWRLIGFTDNEGVITSSPTCEDPKIGIVFYDKLLVGFPIEDPDARTFSITSAVWTRPGQLFLVYSKSSNNSLFISRAVNPSWMPPRPATAPTNNFSSLTKDMVNKYDSLSRIFGFNEKISFFIQGNTLKLQNPISGINAMFVFESD